MNLRCLQPEWCTCYDSSPCGQLIIQDLWNKDFEALWNLTKYSQSQSHTKGENIVNKILSDVPLSFKVNCSIHCLFIGDLFSYVNNSWLKRCQVKFIVRRKRTERENKWYCSVIITCEKYEKIWLYTSAYGHTVRKWLLQTHMRIPQDACRIICVE